MEEEEDLESIKNHSLNPLLDTDTILSEFMNMEDEIWINTKTNVATSLAAEAKSKKLELSPEQLVPEEYHEYLNIVMNSFSSFTCAYYALPYSFLFHSPQGKHAFYICLPRFYSMLYMCSPQG